MQKRLLLNCVAVAAMAFVMVAPAHTQDANQQEVKRFDVALADADLHYATQTLATVSGLNLQFVFAPTDKEYKRITLSLTGVTVDDAMKYICEAAGAEFRKDPGGVYVIMPKGANPVEPAKSAGAVVVPEAPKVVQKIVLTHYHPREMLQLLFAQEVDRLGEWKALLRFRQMHAATYIGKDAGNPVVIADSPASYQNLTNPGANPNVNPAPTATGSNNNGITIPGGSDQGGLVGGGGGGQLGGGGQFGGGGGFGGGGFGGGGQFGGGGGFGFGQGGQVNLQGGQGFVPQGIERVTFDPTDNSLIVQGTDDAIQQLERLIRQLDVAPQQVIIKVEFITTSQSQERNFGIDWLFQRGQVFLGNTPGTQARAGDPFFVNWATGNLTTRLRTLLLEGNGTVVNAPFVRTLNNQPAFILQQISTFIILNQVIAVGNGQVISAPTLQNITVQSGLSVQPRINRDGTIVMTISPQVAEFGEIRRAPDGTEVPDVLSQTIFVTARVKNGETIVLGGLTRRQETFTVQRYPILSDLPLIGGLFRSTSKKLNNQELLVFITPTIVEDESTGGGIGAP